MKGWFNPHSIGVREVTDKEYEALWQGADWPVKFANDTERADREWDRLMEPRKGK